MGAVTRRRAGRAGGSAAGFQALRMIQESDRFPAAAKVLMWVKFPHIVIPAFLAVWSARWVGGRVMLRKRATDATFVHRARAVRGGWWAERAGWVRHVARLAPAYVLLAWALWGATVAALLTVCAVALAAWWGTRRRREWVHDRAWLLPMWPAIEHALGTEAVGAPPRSWVELPDDPGAPDAEVVIGLPCEIGDDARVVAALRVILDQRLAVGRWVPELDSAARLVTFRPRPADPELWPAVAAVLRLDPVAEVSRDWLTVPPDARADGARVVITLPPAIPDPARVVEQLRELVGARLPGAWSTRSALSERVVALVHRPVAPAPPRMAPAGDAAAFADRFGGVLPDLADLEGLLSEHDDEPTDAPAGPVFVALDDDDEPTDAEIVDEHDHADQDDHEDDEDDEDEPMRGAA